MNEQREITAKLCVTDIRRGWDEHAKASDYQARLLIGAKTDLGCVRENNEDKFEFYIPSSSDALACKGALVAVADGMGGHAAGQVASELGLKTFIRSYFADDHADVENSLKMAVSEANEVVYGTAVIPGRSGMGCTLTAAVIRGKELYAAQVGDSRLYLFRDETLRQVTTDHSWVAEQVLMGAMNEDEAELSPFRNVITRSLGNQPSVEPDIFKLEACEGDKLLLCSDGLSGVVKREEMEQVIVKNGPAESCQILVDMALDRGGPDNITVLIAQIEEIQPLSSPKDKPSSTHSEKKGFFHGLRRG